MGIACRGNYGTYNSSDRLGDLCVQKLWGGCTQVYRVNANGALDRTRDLRGCRAAIMITHEQCLRPDPVCQVLYPSESDLLPVQPCFCGAQLASVFVYDLLWIQPKPLVSTRVRPRACDYAPASVKRSTILRTLRNLHHVPRHAWWPSLEGKRQR